MLPDIPARVSYPGMGDTLAEDEEVLQRHVLRVQETLMDAVDKRVKTFEGKLREKDSLLKNTLDDKHNLAIELYRAQNQVEKLNESLGTMYTIINFSFTNCIFLTNNHDAETTSYLLFRRINRSRIRRASTWSAICKML